MIRHFAPALFAIIIVLASAGNNFLERNPTAPAGPEGHNTGSTNKQRCDSNCHFDRRDGSCRGRVSWLINHKSMSSGDALWRVNSDCAGQCTCSAADMGFNLQERLSCDADCKYKGTVDSCRKWVVKAGANAEVKTLDAGLKLVNSRCSDQCFCRAVDFSDYTGYELNWVANGTSFFQDFEFVPWDGNHGASHYAASYEEAKDASVAEAFENYAILRAGRQSHQQHKRRSAKIRTRRSWTHFLAVMRFSHVPHGCGVWPAFFTVGANMPWPQGGEMDILEYVNDAPAMASFHTSKTCSLHPGEVSKYGAMPDFNQASNNGSSYNCYTKYCSTCKSIGCAPNSVPLLTGEQWAERPGVIAMERARSFTKLFFIPEDDLPADLETDAPRPETWDKWIISYYPFDASERRRPGSCPDATQIMSPQQFIITLAFCGDWASKVWGGSSCTSMGPTYNRTAKKGQSLDKSQCRAVDPLAEHAPEQDCCTQFIVDADGKYGTDDYLDERAFFNITSLKIYQPAASSNTPVPTCHTALPGESCHGAVLWAMQDGMNKHPEWYVPYGLTSNSSFEEFQAFLHDINLNGGVCLFPCGLQRNVTTTTTPAPPEYASYPGVNCWAFGNGGDDILGKTPLFGLFSEAQCMDECSKEPRCEGFVMQKGSGAKGCWLRTNVQLSKCSKGTQFDFWAQLVPKDAAEWTAHPGLNCYKDGHGGDGIAGKDPLAGEYLEAHCKSECYREAQCEGIVIPKGSGPRTCWLRTKVQLGQCTESSNFDFWAIQRS